jgi:metal-responsive CopG/Arc/MetJ family transcriptional regulator
MSMAPKTERFEMRLETTMIERVDAWRRKQEDLPSRAEAFRRLIELGLSAKKTGPKVKT